MSLESDRVTSLPQAACALAALLLAAAQGRAQGLQWEPMPFVPGFASVVRAAVDYDDGTGPEIYFGFPAAGNPVARWNGERLEPVGSGLSGEVNALAVFETGGVASLYAGGGVFLQGSRYTMVRWNGADWIPITGASPTGAVTALAVHDDGSGLALYAAGSFQQMGWTFASAIARWNGTTWSTVGAGLAGRVDALVVHDDGAGRQLFLGGQFSELSGAPLRSLARWDGTAFSTLGAGLAATASVTSLTVYDVTGGAMLVAGGSIPSAGGVPASGVVGWRAGSWTTLGNPHGVNSALGRVTALKLGGQTRLVAGTLDAGFALVKEWNGLTWTPITDGLSRGCGSNAYGAPTFVASLDLTGAGNELCVSGGFDVVPGGDATTFARRTPAGWESALPSSVGLAPASALRSLASFDDGSGSALYVGGFFCQVSGTETSYAARWRAGVWESLHLPPSVLNSASVGVFGVADLGNGPELYAGGTISLPIPPYSACTGVARWTGAGWSPLGFGVYGGTGLASAFASVDLGSGPRLYVGGSFTFAHGVASPNFAAWDGTTWRAQPPGPTAGLNAAVRALAVFDSGAEPRLYLGGSFTQQTAGTPLARIARWNGTSYSALGSGMNGDVWALRTFDDGTGTKLYAAGAFTTAGGVSVQRVARFDGTAWSPVGAGFDALVTCLEVFDDGSGPALYAAGDFMSSGSTPVTHVARWDGVTWSALGNGIGPSVYAMASHAEAPGEPAKLFVGGSIQTAGLLPTSNLAAWRGCGGAIDRFCFGDGTSSACPCDNSSLASRGCNNSAGSGGARLNATGAANPDTITLYVAGETPSAATLVFQGDVLLSSPISFGDGLRCVGGNSKRLYTTNAVNGSLAVPSASQPSVSARSAQLGDVLAPGSVRGYQAWYRDVSPSFCAPPAGANWNLSNAVRVVW